MANWNPQELALLYAERRKQAAAPVAPSTPRAVAAKRDTTAQSLAKAIIRDTTVKMTKPERQFTQYCELRRIAGEVQTWAYEPISFALANGASYTPDVLVVENDLTISFFDTKAFAKNLKKPLYTQWSMAAMKMTAERYPYFRFSMCWQNETGEWCYRNFIPRGV